MAKHEATWHAILPGGLSPAAFSLDELRTAKDTHDFLTEAIQGPEGIAYYIRGFRYLLLFGIACIAEDKYLTWQRPLPPHFPALAQLQLILPGFK